MTRNPSAPLAGSLFTGTGALDLAISDVFGTGLAWYAEYEPPTEKNPRPRNAGARLLAHRFPGVPNLGDVTEVAWAGVPRVHVAGGGYPCQGQSQSGLRLGQADERWMWPSYRDCIAELRPRWAVGENVAGHVTMDLRQVVADLQAIGYAVVWVTVAASQVGACHERKRVFWLAWPEVHGAPAWASKVPFAHLHAGQWGVDGLFGVEPVGEWAYQGAAYQGAAPGSSLLPTPRTTDTNGVGAHGDGGLDLRTTIAALLPTPNAGLGDTHRGGWPNPQVAAARLAAGKRYLDDAISVLLPTPDCTHGRKSTRTGLLLPGVVEALLPTPCASNPNDGEDLESWEARRQRNLAKGYNGNGQGTPLSIAVRQMLPTPKASDAEKGGPNQRGSSGDLALPAAVQPQHWAQYGPAIARHEAALGRPAPSPTGPHGRSGEQRLDGRFTEWMMMLPEGWVTDVPGVSNKDAIRLCGNGVVRHQAGAALRYLLAKAHEGAAAVAA